MPISLRPPARSFFAVLSLALVSVAPATAQETARRPVTHEDVWLMRRLSEPVLSPDGRHVVVSVTEPSYEKGKTRSDLWIVETDGSVAPRRLTTTDGSESSARWSPDGTRLLFVAKRGDDDDGQVWVLDMDRAGEPRKVTEHAGSVANPRWSPDGSRIVFESFVKAEPGPIEREDEVSVSAYATFPVRYWDRWLEDGQVHLFVQDVDAPGTAKDLLAGSELAAREGFSGVPGRGQDGLQACWTPDGSGLVFVATTERDRSAFASVRYHLYGLAIAGGAPQRLTDDADASESRPRFSRDGTRLFYFRDPIGAHVYEPAQLMARAWSDAATSVQLAASFDRPINSFVELGEEMWLVGTEHGRRRVFGLGDDGAQLLDEDSRGVLAGLSAARGGDGEPVLVARWEDSTHPAEIVRVDPDSGAHAQLTSFNVDRAARLEREPFREFWFASECAGSKGRSIHCWLVVPPGFDENKKYPLLTWMHGGPHSSSMDADHVRWSPHLLAAPGYVVVMPDYTGSVGYGKAFAQAIQGDPLQTPGDELLQAAAEAKKRFAFIDDTRQAALGASYGGHLANWMQARTEHFRCLVGHAGLVSLEGQWATSDVIFHREQNNGGPPWGDSAIWREQSPSTYAAAFKTPMMLTVGERDYRVPLNQTLAAWSYLQRQQVESRLLVFHQANHWIMRGPDARYFWREVHAWLASHLDG